MCSQWNSSNQESDICSIRFGSGPGDNLRTWPDPSWQPGPDILGSGLSSGSGLGWPRKNNIWNSMCQCITYRVTTWLCTSLSSFQCYPQSSSTAENILPVTECLETFGRTSTLSWSSVLALGFAGCISTLLDILGLRIQLWDSLFRMFLLLPHVLLYSTICSLFLLFQTCSRWNMYSVYIYQ